MALAKGVNSYATVAEADSYFLDRLDAAVWSAADATKKAQALITASDYLNDQKWVGIAVSDSQSLAFPREGSYFDSRVGAEVILESNVVPTRIITATYELALHLLSNSNLLDDTGGVKSIAIGSIKIDLPEAANKMSSNIKRIIKPLLQNQGERSWWRAN
jgi:hypothetical protein